MAFADGKLADLADAASRQPAGNSRRGERSFAQARREVTVAGLVARHPQARQPVSVTLDDDTGRMEVSLFSEAFQEFRHLLVKDEIVVVTGGLALRRLHRLPGPSTRERSRNIDRVIESKCEAQDRAEARNPTARARELCWSNCTMSAPAAPRGQLRRGRAVRRRIGVGRALNSSAPSGRCGRAANCVTS